MTVQERGWGQWRDRHGVIERERSYELTLFYPATESWQHSTAIEEIRKAYRTRFAQESVARVDDRVRVSF